jgi:Domain of unknown function (DUF1772)
MHMVRFLNVVMAGLLAGIIVGIWVGFNPETFSFSTYLEHQQGAINALNVPMPLMGLVTIVLTLFSAFSQKENKAVFIILLLAAVLLIASGLITKFGNQPINKIVMMWSIAAEPADWVELRDRWWTLHQLRSICSLIAFFLIAWTSIKRS